MLPPPPTILPVLEKFKGAYKLWNEYHGRLPKSQRYTLGNKVDMMFIEIIEMIAWASFLSKSEKSPYIKVAIRKLDTVKVLLMILWETRGLDEKKYITLSVSLHEIGRNLGGWYGQIIKQNSPDCTGEK